MPQIVHPRLVACPIVASNARLFAYPLKGLVRRIGFDLPSIPGHKEWRIAHCRFLMVHSMVSEQYVAEIGTDRNHSGAVLAAALNVDPSPAKIYITLFEFNCLADHCAGSIQKQEQGTKGATVDDAVKLPLDDSGRHEQPLELGPRVNVGHKCLYR
jgi:hypothetical protein